MNTNQKLLKTIGVFDKVTYYTNMNKTENMKIQ